MSDLPELKPCPFCGGESEYMHSGSYTTGHNERGDDVGVQCRECLANVTIGNYMNHEVFERKLEAAKIWNRRVQ